jgi:AP endonuclease-1
LQDNLERRICGRKWVGAHVSAAGGVDWSVHNALQIGANAFALFLKSPRKWESPDIDAEVCKRLDIG